MDKDLLIKLMKGMRKMKNNSNTGITLCSQLFFVMYTTGLRQGELLSLKWHDNDSDRKNN